MLQAAGAIRAARVLSPNTRRACSILGTSFSFDLAHGELRNNSAKTLDDSGDTNSPQTLCRGNLSASSKTTRDPWRAAVMAADVPAGPPPITARSNSDAPVLA